MASSQVPWGYALNSAALPSAACSLPLTPLDCLKSSRKFGQVLALIHNGHQDASWRRCGDNGQAAGVGGQGDVAAGLRQARAAGNSSPSASLRRLQQQSCSNSGHKQQNSPHSLALLMPTPTSTFLRKESVQEAQSGSPSNAACSGMRCCPSAQHTRRTRCPASAAPDAHPSPPRRARRSEATRCHWRDWKKMVAPISPCIVTHTWRQRQAGGQAVSRRYPLVAAALNGISRVGKLARLLRHRETTSTKHCLPWCRGASRP